MNLRTNQMNDGVRHTGRDPKRYRTWHVLLLVCGLVLAFGLAVSADPPYPVTVTITGDAPDASVVGEAYKVEFEVRITPVDSLSPWGTVTVEDGTGGICSKTVLSGVYSNGWSSWCNLTSTSAGIKTITATFVPDPSVVPAKFTGDSDTETHTVIPADTSTGVTSSGSFSVYGEPVTFTATVLATSPGGGTPTGTVSFYSGGNLLGSASSSTTNVMPFTTDQLLIGTHSNITAVYAGNDDYNGSTSIAITQEVSLRNTTTIVFGSDTALVVHDTATCTVTVVDTSPGTPSIPTGDVTVGVSPSGTGTLTGGSHTLVVGDAGEFTFTYTPSSAATTPHTFTATYTEDITTHNGSIGIFNQAIDKRDVDIELSLTPTTAYIGQGVAVTVHVEDDTDEGTPDPNDLDGQTVTLSTSSDTGLFESGAPGADYDATLDASGNCTVTYIPGPNEAGTTAITATYAGSSVYKEKSASGNLVVNLRPTQTRVVCSMDTILVNQDLMDGDWEGIDSRCTITVEDIATEGTATSPAGSIALSTSVLGTSTANNVSTPTTPDSDESQWKFDYVCTGLDDVAAFDTIQADYTADDGIHADSAGAFGQGIQRRPTVTTLPECNDCENATADCSTPDGWALTVTTEEVSGNAGAAANLSGTIVLLGGSNIDMCTQNNEATISCDYEHSTGAVFTNATVKFEPSDKIHLPSTASVNIDRSCQFDPGIPDDPPDAGACDAGCGTGGIDIDAVILALNIADTTLAAVQLGLETAAIFTDFIPDLIIGGGLFAITGVTIPISDIASAVLAGSGVALEIARMVMTTDLDGDGLPDVVEAVTGTSTTMTDTDGDGLGDYDEISEAGGFYGGTRRPSPNVWDSDGDTLSDGDEAGLYNTSFCVGDTDCDTISDGAEVATWGCSDPRNHADPLMIDTDGDGLDDDIEFSAAPGCNSCPFANDDDSDDDGLQDGYEDANQDGTIDNSIGTDLSHGSGETHFCSADTDGDGLLDGEEEGLFGTSVTPEGVSASVGSPGGPISLGSPASTTTFPALDIDMDNDGLTDYEEVNVYQTDPMDADTDDDTISDSGEVATWGSSDERNHANPREADTDGDGLTDDLEIVYGCTYVNDDDSDDDGLQDGWEDRDRDGTWDYTNIGDTSDEGAGETDPCDADTDNDGLLDGEEEGLFGQDPVTSVTRLSSVTTVPALDKDSDNDGLSDYEEVNITGTDPLDADSDDDDLLDSWELIVTGGDFPNRSFYQESDPLDPDTDDDGIRDDVEYNNKAGSGVLRSYGDTSGNYGNLDTACPYVNDDDSDDDGLQDGTEGWLDRDINITYVLGHTGTHSGRTAQDDGLVGETDFCDPDTDGDGLTDGEEFALFGGLLGDADDWHPSAGTDPAFQMVAAVNPAGATVLTIPALDDDCDDDGLSDYEEVNVTGTDPLDADTDDDGLLDSWELIVTSGNFPNRSFYQESDPLDPDTDDDEIRDDVEYNDGAGSGVDEDSTPANPGDRDEMCPFVNDDDSDDDGLQDGVEDANHDGAWGIKGSGGITVGQMNDGSQASKGSLVYWETDLCNPDTDGDGLLDGEEVSLIGGLPVLSGGFDPQNRLTRLAPGFNTVRPQAVSIKLPDGSTYPVPDGYTAASPIPGTTTKTGIGPYTFMPEAGDAMTGYETIPALDVDSDNDGLSDYEEVNITGTDPLDQDTDNDTLMDADELIATGGLEDTPGNPGIGPRRTFDQESDPLDINTDDDHLFDPQEYYYEGQYGSGLSAAAGGLNGSGIRDEHCPYVNDDDSDDDGIQDGAWVTITPPGVITSDGSQYTYTHYEDFIDLNDADQNEPVVPRTVPTLGDGEQSGDTDCDVCDADSDDDGLLDGEEIAIGTNPDDYDTDDDGRNDWHEVTGGGPIPTDPFDPDTDDDGLLDSVEVWFGSNTTNPTNADTDGDGLCDGGTGTPWMKLYPSDLRVVVNPICKSCATPGLTDCGIGGIRSGSADGIGDHPNPHGYGEDKNGNGQWDGAIGQLWQSGDEGTPETDPNQYDTDGDAEGDGIEVLGFSTSRQGWIPATDLFGRTINVTYPFCGCLEPLVADTDGDGLSDGYEDNNHDGNFDFLPSDFDYAPDPLPGPPQPNPNETNPCDADTDDDDLTDYEERYQAQVFVRWVTRDNDGDGLYDEDPVDGIDNDGDLRFDEDPVEAPVNTFNPTNPLDHDTDNDRLLDGFEVKYECLAVTYSQLDNDGDALFDEDPIDLLDNDGDGLFDEDPVDFFVRFVPMLDPTCRDSDSDGFIDGLDDDPCNSELIPILQPVQMQPIDTDGDGFSDDDEIVAGTHPNDPEDYPTAYCKIDLDFDQEIDDRLWLEPTLCCGIANSVAIDIDSNVLIDARVRIIAPRDVKQGDFDGDGVEDDYRYVVEYAFSNYRVVQPRIVLTIDDYNGDLVIDHAEVVKK